MENLEKTLEKVELKREESRPPAKKLLYKGFKLVEEKVYAGGTSIRYWM